jgi:uncharacterized protein YbaP (TraB family)
MLRLLLAITVLAALAAPLRAGCDGRDLIAALPAPERAALAAAAAASPYPNGNLWRATRGDAVVHIVGTYHFPDRRHDVMIDRVRPLLAGAATVLVEAGPEEEKALAAELARRPEFMFLTDGPTLPEMLPEPDWQALAAEMRLRGVPPFLGSKLRPWYVAMLLNLPPCAMPSLKAGGGGLDELIIRAAQDRGVAIRALEPFDTLFRIFEPLSMAQELDLIRVTMLMVDGAEDYTTTLANAYFRGESRIIWEFTLDQARRMPGADPAVIAEQFVMVETHLMNARNRNWIPVILHAAQDGPVLAAFGALHLSGEQGVLALLAAEGFAIEPL